MTYKPTILNISAGILILSVAINTFSNYSTLSAGEGWGLLFALVFGAMGILMLLADLMLQQWIKDRKKLNIIGGVLAFIAVVIFLSAA